MSDIVAPAAGGALVAVVACVNELSLRSRRPALSWWRRGCGLLAVLLALLAVAGQPVFGRSLWAVTLQLCLVVFGVAPLAVLAAPGRRRWLAESAHRRGLSGPQILLVALAAYALVVIAWRVPTTVDAIAHSPGLVLLEVVTAFAGSWPLWDALIGDGDDRPGPPLRVAFAALASWTAWVVAYVLGFTNHALFPAYRALDGGARPVWEQELAAIVLFVAATAALVPVAFVNLVRWLGADAARGEGLTAADVSPGRYLGEPREGWGT